MEAGVQLSWTAGGESTTRFGLGARYLLDPCTAIRAKVNNQSQVGLGFEQKIRDGMITLNSPFSFPKRLQRWLNSYLIAGVCTGVTLTLSTFIDGKNFKAGGHKVGIALDLEP